MSVREEVGERRYGWFFNGECSLTGGREASDAGDTKRETERERESELRERERERERIPSSDLTPTSPGIAIRAGGQSV